MGESFSAASRDCQFMKVASRWRSGGDTKKSLTVFAKTILARDEAVVKLPKDLMLQSGKLLEQELPVVQTLPLDVADHPESLVK